MKGIAEFTSTTSASHWLHRHNAHCQSIGNRRSLPRCTPLPTLSGQRTLGRLCSRQSPWMHHIYLQSSILLAPASCRQCTARTHRDQNPKWPLRYHPAHDTHQPAICVATPHPHYCSGSSPQGSCPPSSRVPRPLQCVTYEEVHATTPQGLRVAHSEGSRPV